MSLESRSPRSPPTFAALADDAVHDDVELADVAFGALVARRGDPHREVPHAFEPVAEVVEGFFEGLGDFVADVAQVDVEERFADDGQGEAVHFAVQVAGFAVAPVVD